MNILLLEDDTLLAQSVQDELEEQGYTVTWVGEANCVIDITYETRFDMYLFDVNLPDMSGFKLLESLRKCGDNTPTIFMTSRNQIEDLREGFNAGADDYIKKPFDIDELIIRIHSKIPQLSSSQLTPDFYVDAQEYICRCKGNTIKLPAREFALLEYFIRHKNQLLETHTIMEEFDASDITLVTFRTYIKNIKRHIKECGVIENVKGIGYRFKLL